MPGEPILFYDAGCGFCSGMVQFAIRHEQTPQLRFAPIDGTTAEAAGISSALGYKSIVLLDGQHQYIRTRALRRVMMYMGGRWKTIARLLGIVPTPLADLGYRAVAAIRHLLPGPATCPAPPADQRARFLN